MVPGIVAFGSPIQHEGRRRPGTGPVNVGDSEAPAERAGDQADLGRGVTRRTFLGKAAAAAVCAAALRPALAAIADETGRVSTEAAPGTPQWAMVIDLALCDGCMGCTHACQWTHFTGDQEWMKVFEFKDESGRPYFVPRPCMHCENAPCLNVCPVGATFRTDEGVILVDHDRCIGCRFCMAACPYGARSFNWGEPENPPGASLEMYSPDNPIPHRRGTVEKCMWCAHTTHAGGLPACVVACPMGAIYFGDLVQDIVSNGLETVKLSWLLRERDGFRLKEELGTRPRVWYLPGHGEKANLEVNPI